MRNQDRKRIAFAELSARHLYSERGRRKVRWSGDLSRWSKSHIAGAINDFFFSFYFSYNSSLSLSLSLSLSIIVVPQDKIFRAKRGLLPNIKMNG